MLVKAREVLSLIFFCLSQENHSNLYPYTKEMKNKFKAVAIGATASLLLGASSFQAQAQESFGGLPPTFMASKTFLRSAEAPNIIRVNPDFNPADLRALNDWGTNNELHLKPLHIGQVVPTSIDFAKEAKKTTLEYGKEVYRLVVSSPLAQAVILTYKDFFIPNDGAKLFIYNRNKSALLGAYTYQTHPMHGGFSTEPIKGDELTLEYVPGSSNTLPSILIDGLGYITYSHLGLGTREKIFDPGEDNSDPLCQVPVNCPEGAEWQTEKTGVIQMVMFDKYEGKVVVGCCSANLINNTNQDFKPYIITAAHCIEGDNEKPITTQDLLDKWIFRFHYEKPTCSNGSEALSRGKSIVGCEVKTYLPITDNKGTPKSDGMLLLAKQEVPKNYRVYYNGWDRYTALPKGAVVGMHHPSGDAKKICYAPRISSVGTWDTPDSKGDPGAHFRVEFKKGDTEGGSSGSSLFDSNHLVIGTLTGGRSGCGSTNYYGRLNRHWDNFKDPENPLSSMDIYLDPKTEGEAKKLEGTWRENLKPLQKISKLTINFTDDNDVKVTWAGIDKAQVPTDWKITYYVYRNGEKIKEITDGTELQFIESRTDALGGKNREGGVVYGIQVHYDFNGLSIPDDGYNKGKAYTADNSEIVEHGVYLGKLIDTVTAEVKANSSKGVDVIWKAPVYLQEVSLFGYPEKLELDTYKRPYYNIRGRWDTPNQFRLVQRMASEKFVQEGKEMDRNFRPEEAPCVYAVKLVPDTKAKGKYTICIRNGVVFDDIKNTTVGNLYEQAFDVPDDWKPGEWLTIPLKEPYKFNPMEDLFVGYGTPNDKVNGPLGVAYVKNSNNEIRRYLDAFVLANEMLHPVPEDYLKGFNPPEAYHAIRVVFSSSDKAEVKKDFECFAKGVSPVQFPKVKEYKVLKNGTEVATVAEGTKYHDAEGKTSDKYEIKVSYDKVSSGKGQDFGTSEVEANIPEVFPTQLDANATLNLKNAESVATLKIYSMEGALVMNIAKPQSTIDLSTLSMGVYVVVLETGNQKISQRINKVK